MHLLLENDANADASALITASHKGYEGIVRLLLEKGCGFEAQNKKHSSALGAASENGHENNSSYVNREGCGC